jgi:hypothetical protein
MYSSSFLLRVFNAMPVADGLWNARAIEMDVAPAQSKAAPTSVPSTRCPYDSVLDEP